MSNDISKSLADLKFNGEAGKAIYGVGCYQGAIDPPVKLESAASTLNFFDYNWKLNCDRRVTDDVKTFVISAEMTSRYIFEDTLELAISIKNGDKLLFGRNYTLDKCDRQEFEVEYDKTWPISFEKIEVTAILSMANINYYRNNWATEYCLKFSGRPHDVILVVGESKFYMFKNYLATWSKYFDRLFYGDFKEKNQVEIKIEDVDSVEFELVLSLIHPQLLRQIHDKNVTKVLKLADRFEIPNLMARCGELLGNFSKCMDLSIINRLELADNYNLVSLKIACFQRVHSMDDKARVEFFEKNRRRIQNLSTNTIKNLI